MRRKVRLPFSAEQVYRAILDPMILSAWFDVPYASTGWAPLQLFEIEDRGTPPGWKFRGFVVETVANRKIRIEREDKNAEAFRALVILLSRAEEGCEMEVAWSSTRLDRLASAFLDPRGHQRLGLVLDRFPEIRLPKDGAETKPSAVGS